jgi:hypothetical protein
MNRRHTTSRCKRECMRTLTEYAKMSHYNTGIDDHEQGYGEPPVSQSLQAKDRDRQS